MRYELTDFEWTAIRPFLPNKPRDVPRVNGHGDNVSVADVETLHRVLQEVRALAELASSARVGRRLKKDKTASASASESKAPPKSR